MQPFEQTPASGQGDNGRELAALPQDRAPRLAYSGDFHAGTITYIEADIRFDLWHEMGGGACRFFINLPTPAHWAGATGTPLARRDEIVAFVAETVRREKASSWHYVIEDGQITFY